MKEIFVSPSILSANLLNLQNEVNLLKQAGANALHIDVMDGHFVKNISFGVPIVANLKKCGLPLDLHLMVTNPFNFIEIFADAGADFLTFHVECSDNLKLCLKKARSLGCKAGVAVNPKTDISCLSGFLNDESLLDLVVVMSVEPGFSGQSFIFDVLHKISYVKSLNSSVDIAVDGGVNCKNSKLAVQAGANWLIVGSTIFNSKNYSDVIECLKH